jgi:hypothetical protein
MSEPDPTQPATPQIDQAQLAYAVERLRSEENFPLALIAGTAAAAVGAAAWTTITVLTEYQIGFMAVGVGILVALTIRVTGKGMSQKFQILGAVLSLLGCAAGNFLTVCYFIASNEHMTLLELLPQIDPVVVPDIMISTFAGMDLLFYGIAVYEGYRLSLRQVSEDDLTGLA